MKSPHNELIIYETHVRGFTKDESSGVKYKGTYAGLVEKIPYLKELGITALELLPIFEFDEFEGAREISFKGLDNKIYYILTPEGYYYNFSGCGNTLNCNNPPLLDSLAHDPILKDSILIAETWDDGGLCQVENFPS